MSGVASCFGTTQHGGLSAHELRAQAEIIKARNVKVMYPIESHGKTAWRTRIIGGAANGPARPASPHLALGRNSAQQGFSLNGVDEKSAIIRQRCDDLERLIVRKVQCKHPLFEPRTGARTAEHGAQRADPSKVKCSDHSNRAGPPSRLASKASFQQPPMVLRNELSTGRTALRTRFLRLFAYEDLDESGTCDRGELKAVLERAAGLAGTPGVAPELLEALFARYDPRGDGLVTFGEIADRMLLVSDWPDGKVHGGKESELQRARAGTQRGWRCLWCVCGVG